MNADLHPAYLDRRSAAARCTASRRQTAGRTALDLDLALGAADQSELTAVEPETLTSPFAAPVSSMSPAPCDEIRTTFEPVPIKTMLPDPAAMTVTRPEAEPVVDSSTNVEPVTRTAPVAPVAVPVRFRLPEAALRVPLLDHLKPPRQIFLERR